MHAHGRDHHHLGALRDVGTNGVRVFTADDGWVWTFAAVDRWDAEFVGWHVRKVGSRFGALGPIARPPASSTAGWTADVARGLALRTDHRSQHLSNHFIRQIQHWGVRGDVPFCC